MKLAYFDCTFGAAGDMLLAALIGAGANIEEVNRQLGGLAIEPDAIDLTVEEVLRCSLSSSKLTVNCRHAASVESANGHDGARINGSDSGNSHDHGHEHEHDNELESEQAHDHSRKHERFKEKAEHANDHSHRHDQDHGHGRTFTKIRSIIEASNIAEPAKDLAIRIFLALAEAEASVHASMVEEVHFHEVGALDAIADIVGFAIAYHLLGIERSVVSALPLGSGVVKTEHGIFPVPGPAVGYLIKQSGAPVSGLHLSYECLTPTGAAILTTIASQWSGPPAFDKIGSIGYGAGSLDPQDHPNVSRVFVGTAQAVPGAPSNSVGIAGSDGLFISEMVAVIETDLDDCSPNLIAYACERLFDAGALDVTITPTVMKKNRSGHHLCILTRPELKEAIVRIVLSETSTLGVRCSMFERTILKREFAQVSLPGDTLVKVKVGSDQSGNIMNVQPEYQDCASYAQVHNMPIKDVFELVLRSYENQKSGSRA